MVFTIKIVGKKAFIHRRPGVMTEAERLAFWAEVLYLLSRRVRFPQYPMLRPGKARWRAERVLGVEREFNDPDRFGLECLHEPEVIVRGSDSFVWHLPDWELLNWWSSLFIVVRANARAIEVPATLNGIVRPFLGPRAVRAITTWSQSKLEKHADECPGLLKEPGQYGVAWAVDTIEFVSALGDPRYPFMPRPWPRHDLRQRAA